jgi:Protein of unknown function (DUF3352)
VRRFVLPVVLLAFLVAGCGSGGSSSNAGGNSIPAGASLVRAGVVAFVAIDRDTGSGQWEQLDDLAQKFPGRDEAIAQFKDELTKEGVDYDDDVKPALGPELDLAVVSAGTEESTRVVGLTKPDDPAKFKTLVAKLNANDSGGDAAVYREVGDGWYAISDSQLAITSALKRDQTALADDDTFKQAMGKLAGDALVKAYLDGQRVNQLVSRAAAKSGSSLGTASLGLDKLKYLAAAVSAEDDGLRVHGASSGGNLGSSDFTSQLIGGVPENALALLDFSGKAATEQLDQLRSSPQFGEAAKELTEYLGITTGELISLFGGELAFYVRSATVIPEFTLALHPQDESAALAALDKLAAHVAAMAGGQVESGTQGDRQVKTVDLGQFAIHYGSVGDAKIVITTGLNGVADYGSGSSLQDSADFKEAKDAAGMPDSTGDVVYVDIKNFVPLLEGFASLAGGNLPKDVVDNLRPVRSLLAWSEGEGDSRTFDAFLEIK